MNETKTISIKPTRSEHARITAYILANHASVSPEFFGPYWELSPAQENALFATWNRLEELNVGAFEWRSLPKSHKAKLIKGVYVATLDELTQ